MQGSFSNGRNKEFFIPVWYIAFTNCIPISNTKRTTLPPNLGRPRLPPAFNISNEYNHSYVHAGNLCNNVSLCNCGHWVSWNRPPRYSRSCLWSRMRRMPLGSSPFGTVCLSSMTPSPAANETDHTGCVSFADLHCFAVSSLFWSFGTLEIRIVLLYQFKCFILHKT